MSDFLNWEMTNRMHNLGYDGKTLMYIDDEEDIINDDSAELIGAKPAILTSAAFRWFREKHGICGYVSPLEDGSAFYHMIYTNINVPYSNRICTLPEKWETHEEAELACLEKLLEIVESKKE